MYTPDVVQTINKERLTLKTSVFLQRFHLLFQTFFNGLPFILASLLITDLSQPYLNKQLTLAGMLVISFMVSYFLVRKQYTPTVISGINQAQFQTSAKSILEEHGFWVVHNNKKALFATCTTNRSFISDNFYAIYTKRTIFLFCVCELPFPFFLLKSKISYCFYQI